MVCGEVKVYVKIRILTWLSLGNFPNRHVLASLILAKIVSNCFKLFIIYNSNKNKTLLKRIKLNFAPWMIEIRKYKHKNINKYFGT